MRLSAQVHGVEATEQMLRKAGKEISKTSKTKVQEAAQIGLQRAKAFAPTWSGATRQAILAFPERAESWIIQSNPPADHPSFPVNVFFDTGQLSAMAWARKGGKPRSPASIGFMLTTEKFLEAEFHKRLGIEISRVLK